MEQPNRDMEGFSDIEFEDTMGPLPDDIDFASSNLREDDIASRHSFGTCGPSEMLYGKINGDRWFLMQRCMPRGLA